MAGTDVNLTERFGQNNAGSNDVRCCRQAPTEQAESAKRRQISWMARCAMFLAQGFDAASMGEIAREAGVSKGTLYVYFDSKEHLFQAIVEEDARPRPSRSLPSIPTTTTSKRNSCVSAGTSCASCAAQPASRRCAP